MANVLTSLAADIYKAADMVGRELTGIIPSVTINGGSERAALNDVVRSHFTRPATVTTITPSMTIPEGDDQTVDNKTMTLDTTAAVKIPWTGEDIKHVDNGSGFQSIYGDQVRQAFRAICNQIEIALWNAIRKGASRAFGTAGTPPFASNFNEIPQVRRILADNGMPFDGMVSLILNTQAGANLRSLAQLQKANEAGGDALLRQGTLLDLQGFMLKESAGISVVTAGTGTGYLVNNGAGLPIGTTVIPVDTGTGTILAGDIVTFAADTAPNRYVVTAALSAGSFTIGAPGLRVAIPDNNAVTLGAAFTPNLALHKTSAELAIRPMADPPGGDLAADTMVVQDPWTGLSFEIKAYKGFKKAMFMVSCVYGVKAWKEQHTALLLG
ncbi:MAG: P22 phage major capsid protein family protein [Blastocatellia bacterium]